MSVDYGIHIIRTDRRSLALTVNGKGEVVVRAPLRAKDAEIEAFVARHGTWIAARREEIARKPKLSLGDGARFTVYGDEYEVKTGNAARFGEGVVFLPRDGREAALVRLLKRETAKRIGYIVAQFAERYGFTYKGIRISSARGRWGSCSRDGMLAFSFRIAFLTHEQACYIAAHELCHTRVFRHDAAFWREVERVCPDWKALRKSLKSQSFYMQYL